MAAINSFTSTEPYTLFWFRRDLRLSDNCGLYHALKDSGNVLGIFIFDKVILDQLEDIDDARVSFIHDQISSIKQELELTGSTLIVKYGEPEQIFIELTEELNVASVYTNHDWEPYALDRDLRVKKTLDSKNIGFKTYKDHLIFEKNEILKPDGTAYAMFTPYARMWKLKMEERELQSEGTLSVFHHYPSENLLNKTAQHGQGPLITLEEMGFERTSLIFPSTTVASNQIKDYEETRNFPAIMGTSRLGIHFRFGTISIREKARAARRLSAVYLNELIWRDFYAMILAHHPHVTHRSFRPEYDDIAWLNDEQQFKLWCDGKTGYPIVDAGMRELNGTGFMHNRVRMIVASFLTKHLLIDWRLGESWFARKLLDFDLASNNGGWQWAAGSGTDAAPYFRIFSPKAQQEKFDPNFIYIKTWIPEWGSPAYPDPIIDHSLARARCLEVYKQALNQM
jgi:deoxyribodipyrimidine photo-lyase